MEQSFESILQQKLEELSQNQQEKQSEFRHKLIDNQKSFYKNIDIQYFASAEDEGRTEKPSEHKLRKAKEEGRDAYDYINQDGTMCKRIWMDGEEEIWKIAKS